jgi:hypothetical protein
MRCQSDLTLIHPYPYQIPGPLPPTLLTRRRYAAATAGPDRRLSGANFKGLIVDMNSE